jgi:hypothetical protein
MLAMILQPKSSHCSIVGSLQVVVVIEQWCLFKTSIGVTICQATWLGTKGSFWIVIFRRFSKDIVLDNKVVSSRKQFIVVINEDVLIKSRLMRKRISTRERERRPEWYSLFVRTTLISRDQSIVPIDDSGVAMQNTAAGCMQAGRRKMVHCLRTMILAQITTKKLTKGFGAVQVFQLTILRLKLGKNPTLRNETVSKSLTK